MTKASEPAPAGKYGERIARGAAFLDERAPGWRQRIDLDKLEMVNPAQCLVGQLFGDYYRALGPNLGLAASEAIPLGLNLAMNDSSGSEDEDRNYETLDAEWRQYIEATR